MNGYINAAAVWHVEKAEGMPDLVHHERAGIVLLPHEHTSLFNVITHTIFSVRLGHI